MVVTDLDRFAGLEPDRLEADVLGPRLAPGGDEELVGDDRSRRRAGSAMTSLAGAADRIDLDPDADIDPELPLRREQLLGGVGLLPAAAAVRRPRAGSPRCPAPARPATARSRPVRRRSRSAASATCFAVVPSRLFQGGASVEPLDRRHATPRCRWRRSPPSRRVKVSSPTTTVRSPASAPLPRNSSMPRSSSHGSMAGVVEIVDHLVAAGKHRPRVELAADRLGTRRAPDRPRPAVRPAAAAPSRACTRRRSTRRRRAPARSGPRRARRPRACLRSPRRQGRLRSRSRRSLFRPCPLSCPHWPAVTPCAASIRRRAPRARRDERLGAPARSPPAPRRARPAPAAPPACRTGS